MKCSLLKFSHNPTNCQYQGKPFRSWPLTASSMSPEVEGTTTCNVRLPPKSKKTRNVCQSMTVWSILTMLFRLRCRLSFLKRKFTFLARTCSLKHCAFYLFNACHILLSLQTLFHTLLAAPVGVPSYLTLIPIVVLNCLMCIFSYDMLLLHVYSWVYHCPISWLCQKIMWLIWDIYHEL